MKAVTCNQNEPIDTVIKINEHLSFGGFERLQTHWEMRFELM